MAYTTKEDYEFDRDVFVAALDGLRQAAHPFYDLVIEQDDFDLADALDDEGFWLSGDDYLGVVEATLLLERLVGRAHARAVA